MEPLTYIALGCLAVTIILCRCFQRKASRYRILLKAYIRHVHDKTGKDFIIGYHTGNPKVGLFDPDMLELFKLSIIAHEERP